MAVTLKTLIEITPFDDQTRQQLLAKLESLTDDQKFRLSSACWTALATKFEAEYKAKVAGLSQQIQDGIQQYNQEEFKKIEEELYRQYAAMLKSAESEEEILEVRKQIEQYKEGTQKISEDINNQPVVQVNPNNHSPNSQNLMDKKE